MARIPVTEYRQTQVPGGAPSTPRGEAVPVSTASAEAAVQLGRVAQDALVKFQDDSNRTAASDAYTQTFSPPFRELYNGYYNLQGKDALDQRPAYEAKMQELRGQVRDGLQNDVQRRYFDEESRKRVEGELDGMARHAAAQRQVWMAKTSDATLDNYSRDAADKYNDETKFAGALQSGLAEVDRYGRSTGQSSEMMRARGEAFVSKAWTERIDRVMLADPLAARDLYQAHQTEVAAAVRPIVEHRLKAAVMPVEAKIAADYSMTGGDMADLERAIQTGDGSLLRVVERAQAAPAAEAPTKAKDTRAMLASWLVTGEAAARKLYPNNPMFVDMVTGVIRGRVATITQAQEGVQKQAQETIFKTINERAPTSVDSLLRDPAARDAWVRLDEATKHGFITRLKGDADADKVSTNPAVMKDVFSRIHAEEGDPRKIQSVSELAQFFGHGLNFSDYTRLKSEFMQNETPEGNRFLRDVQSARAASRRMMGAGIMGDILKQTQPEKLEDAAYRFAADLDAKIDTFRKEKKDPRALLTPGSPDYALTPEKVMSYLPDPRDAARAAAAKAGAPAVAQPPRIADEAAYRALEKGATYIDARDGKRKVKS